MCGEGEGRGRILTLPLRGSEPQLPVRSGNFNSEMFTEHHLCGATDRKRDLLDSLSPGVELDPGRGSTRPLGGEYETGQGRRDSSWVWKDE